MPGPGLFVLVGGWPASGTSTLAQALAIELELPLIAKDEIKEAIMEVLGRPRTVADSQHVGRAAVNVMLEVAARAPAAVLDSTWKPSTRERVRALPGRLVEVRCVVPLEVAQARFVERAVTRHPGHLDLERTTEELWGEPVAPLGVGPLVEVDTSAPVDAHAVATQILRAAGS